MTEVGEMVEVKVFVNLEKNRVTVQIVEQIPIFSDGTFIVFFDRYGRKYIEREGNRYWLVETMDNKKTREWLDEEEAKKIIREAIKERIEERLLNW
jgi:inorganic pyrophosphatase